MTETISLGQLFLLRKELKNEVAELSSSIISSAYYREDQEQPEEAYDTLLSELEAKRKALFYLDSKIATANSLPNTVTFKDISMSLNDARRTKLQLGESLSFYENQIRHIDIFSKRQENDMIYDVNMVPPQMRQVKYKFKVVANLKELKATAVALKKDIGLLDSLIQKADWSITVEAPGE